jgi:hypothetical protein
MFNSFFSFFTFLAAPLPDDDYFLLTTPPCSPATPLGFKDGDDDFVIISNKPKPTQKQLKFLHSHDEPPAKKKFLPLPPPFFDFPMSIYNKKSIPITSSSSSSPSHIIVNSNSFD